MNPADESQRPPGPPLPLPDEARGGTLPWFALSVAAGALLLAAMFFGVSVPLPAPAQPGFESGWVSLELPESGVGGGVLGEQAALFDTEPLFLPTRWNAGRARSFTEMGEGVPQSPFAPYDLAIAPDAAVVASFVAEPAVPILSPEDLLEARYSDFFSQFGRAETATQATPRMAFLRVLNHENIVRELTITGENPAVLREKMWPPVDFLILVGNGGLLLGEPLALGSAGDEEIDRTLRDLVRTHLEGEWLNPGHFRVKVMP